MWDETNQHRGYHLSRDDKEGHMIDMFMCFRRGDVSYYGPNNFEGGLR